MRPQQIIAITATLSIVLAAAMSSRPSRRECKIERAEEQLRLALMEIRIAVLQYRSTNLCDAMDIETLVTSGYLREIPEDPITERSDTWIMEMNPIYCNTEIPPPCQFLGVQDVTSGAEGVGTNGIEYSEW